MLYSSFDALHFEKLVPQVAFHNNHDVLNTPTLCISRTWFSDKRLFLWLRNICFIVVKYKILVYPEIIIINKSYVSWTYFSSYTLQCTCDIKYFRALRKHNQRQKLRVQDMFQREFLSQQNTHKCFHSTSRKMDCEPIVAKSVSIIAKNKMGDK